MLCDEIPAKPSDEKLDEKLGDEGRASPRRSGGVARSRSRRRRPARAAEEADEERRRCGDQVDGRVGALVRVRTARFENHVDSHLLVHVLNRILVLEDRRAVLALDSAQRISRVVHAHESKDLDSRRL